MKAKIQDIKLIDYLQFDEDSQKIYDPLIEAIKPSKTGKQLIDLTFDEVETLKIALQEFELENIKVVYKIFKDTEANDENLYLLEIMQVWKTGVEILNEVANFEQKLKAKVTDEQKEAGIDNFNALKSAGTKIGIGKQFGQRPREVGEWLWFEVWEIRMYNVIENNYNLKLKEILTRNISQ